MIVSFGDAATEALFHGSADRRARRIPADVGKIALRKLDMLNAAMELRDLLVPPGNRLEALPGDSQGLPPNRITDRGRTGLPVPVTHRPPVSTIRGSQRLAAMR